MNQQEFYKRLKEKHGITLVEAHKICHMVFDEIIEIIRDGGSLKIKGLGTLDVRMTNERNGFDPAAKKYVTWSKSKVMHFTPSGRLTKQINGKVKID